MYEVSDQVGRQASVYIRAQDIPIWERAERYAKAHRIPMSGLVMAALERYLEEQDEAKR